MNRPALDIFDTLLESDDFLRVHHPPAHRQQNAVYRLAQLLQAIHSTGNSANDEAIQSACKTWITDFFPGTERRLAQLQERRVERATDGLTPRKRRRHKANENEDPVDTLDSLAQRLQFSLTVALRDWHTRIVFYEWHSRPTAIEGEQPHRRMPAAMLDVLPLPLTGRQFGTYFSQGSTSDTPARGSDSTLSLFAYTNIGRSYVLNFHRLLSDFDGLPGTNVLALSGTSYLRDSTQFHVGQPHGVLLPEPLAHEAITDSQFAFAWQPDRHTHEPIRISGQPQHQRTGLFKELASALVGNGDVGHLGQELQTLGQLAERDPQHWNDRARLLLLVNSYDQARWAADEIRQCWPYRREQVYHLRRAVFTEDMPGDWSYGRGGGDQGSLSLADVETFAQTGDIILVAPINAIGRGFNTLNRDGKAAFGTVYFLTRPYPHPHDTQVIAQELNRRALDWVDDPEFVAWQEDGVTRRAEAVRRQAARYWRLVEQRSYYRTLVPHNDLRAASRADLAATTAGLVIQAVGRLLRGGVPFHAFFVDAAWGPRYARQEEKDTPRTSLLAAMIDLLTEYVATDPISDALYRPLVDALVDIDNFQWMIDPRDKEQR